MKKRIVTVVVLLSLATMATSYSPIERKGDNATTNSSKEAMSLKNDSDGSEKIVEKVNQIDGDTAELAARIIEQEAGSQGYEGKLAVASVLVNRVNDPRFPDDLRGVITARGQFESYSSGRYARVQVSQDSHRALEAALAGKTSTEALYFCNYQEIGPQSKAWFDSLESLGEIKEHRFYK